MNSSPAKSRKKKGRDRALSFRTEKQVGCPDMTLLPSLNNKAIVANLKDRLTNEIIYSTIGPVLVVCNPYKWLHIYDTNTMRKYVRRNRVDVPPHVFATAEAAYRSMISEEENQCVIISGESGAGKTEASKQIQNYIASVSSSGGNEGIDQVKKMFLESNPLLEAFGNAKTLRNNNSSRFGKYFELMFDHFGRPLGGKVSNFLHEKTRVVNPGKGERNFHVFYQLLASKQWRKKFKLKKPENYRYLSASKCYEVDNIDDSQEFSVTEQAMVHCGLSDKRIEAIFGVVASVLQLGNVEFKAKQIADAEGSEIKSMDALRTACETLGLSSSVDDIARALTSRNLRTMAPGGKIETYSVPQNPTQAKSRLDALSKSMFSRLFDLLVARVNAALDIKKAGKMFEGSNEVVSTNADDLLSLGVLDIYGFEIFDRNGFEQLCINYVNEKLQQIFISLTLKAEQDEYASEGIAWTPIPFFNNKVVCDLVEGTKSGLGLLKVLDDTCKTMHSRGDAELDRGFLDNAKKCFSSHQHFQGAGGGGFIVKHYAGDVEYRVSGFGEANKDVLDNDVLELVQGTDRSTYAGEMIKTLFPEVIDWNDKKLPITSGRKIRTQCGELVAKLEDCTPHYVRCVKSNDAKAPLSIDNNRVAHQCQYLGLLENIRVRRAGFAYRNEFHRFVERFALLSSETSGPKMKIDLSEKDGSKAILKAVVKKHNLKMDKAEAQLGRSKVFIRSPETYFELERLRVTVIEKQAAKIQRMMRKFLARRHLIHYRDDMGKRYSEAGKPRRRGSFSRPFDGDYLPKGLDYLREAMMEIIEYYQEGDDQSVLPGDDVSSDAKIEYCDFADRVVENQKSGGVRTLKVLVALTNEALYIMSEPTEDEIIGAEDFHPADGSESALVLPVLLLRRRIDLSQINGLQMSKLADDYLLLQCAAEDPLVQGNKTNWMKDTDAKVCMHSGKKFSLFTRRHHCRFSGNIYCNEVCSYEVPLPDFGWYTPVRIFTENIGLPNTELVEDVMFVTDRKTELCATIIEIVNKRRKKASSKIDVSFSNAMSMRHSEPRHLSLALTNGVGFRVGGRGGNVVVRGKSGFDANMVSEDGNRLIVMVPKDGGIPASLLEEREERLKKRRRKAEKKRKKEQQKRQELAAERERVREEERQERLKEKRRKKQEEKERRKAEEEGGGRTESKKRAGGGGRKFGKEGAAAQKGEGVGTGGGNEQMTELQKAMAARRKKNAV